MKNREWLEFVKEENYLFGGADTPRAIKDRLANLFGKGRPSTIKRTSKRGIEKAKFMNHTSYEYSQWWKKKATKPKMWK